MDKRRKTKSCQISTELRPSNKSVFLSFWKATCNEHIIVTGNFNLIASKTLLLLEEQPVFPCHTNSNVTSLNMHSFVILCPHFSINCINNYYKAG